MDSDVPSFMQKQTPPTQPTDNALVFRYTAITLTVILILAGIAVSVGMYMSRDNPDTVNLYFQITSLWIGNIGILGAILIIMIIISLIVYQPMKTVQRLVVTSTLSITYKLNNLEHRLGVFINWVEKFARSILQKADTRAAGAFMKQAFDVLK